MRNFAVLQLSSSFYDLNNPFTTMWKQTDVQPQPMALQTTIEC